MVAAEGVASRAVAGVEVGRPSGDLNSPFDVAVDGAVAVERLVSEACGRAAVREPTRRAHVGRPPDLVGSGAYRAGRLLGRRWPAGAEPVERSSPSNLATRTRQLQCDRPLIAREA